VRTDHAALKFLRNFAENNSRLMRWNLRLSEFDFDIEHVPGRKLGHVDALSRHIGMIGESKMLDKGLVIEKQKEDIFCKSGAER
jgi:hypothetical protein